MFKSGIRSRLIASFLVLTGLTLLTLGSYILWFFHKHNIERLSGNLHTEARIVEQLLHPYMGGPLQKAGLDTVLKELATTVDHRVTVIDNDGTVLADSWENPAVMENHLYRPEVMDAAAGRKGSAIRYSATLGENMLYTAIPMNSGAETVGVVRVATTLAHVEAGFARIRNILLLAFLGTSVLAVLLSVRLARKYTAPLEEITRTARRMSEGQLSRRVHVRTGDELEVLAHTLNNLAAGLDEKISEITAEKRKLELILENMDNAVILVDRFGRVTDINRQAAATFGIGPAMLGQHNIQVIGYSALDKAMKETVAEGRSRRIDLKTSLAGVKRVFQVFLAPTATADKDITGVLCVFHDITALKEIEERQADFVANASHELSTPLTSIKGFAETLLDGALRDPEASVRFVTIIHEEAERMNRLVKDLLQLARLSAADYRRQVTVAPTPVNDVARTVIDQLQPQWRAKPLAVRLEAAEPLAVLATQDWLTQILLNLLDNAIKFTPPGGTVTVACERAGDQVAIRVKDTGPGIPAADLPFIFDRFYRIDRSRVRESGGTGLGLAIVKFLIETLGGKVEASSIPGLGTTFTVTLPAAE